MDKKLTPVALAIDLRKAVPEDYGFAESLYVETMKPLLAELGAWHESGAISNFKQYYQPEEVLIILVGGAEAGWLQISESPNDINLVQIHLKEEFRSRGIGSELIQGIMAQAAGRGKAVWLSVVRNNPALALYERLGFEEAGEKDYKIQMRWEPNSRS